MNQLTSTMTDIANNIAGSSDIMIKMDTDEFLMVFDNSTKALKPSVSDYLAGYAKDKHHPLRLTKNARFGYIQKSVPSEEVCSEDIYAVPDKFPLNVVDFLETTRHNMDNDSKRIVNDVRQNWKGVWLSSKFFEQKQMNLGGHATDKSYGAIFTDFGALHFHERCLEIEVENCKRAIERHGYISATDTNKEAKLKLVKLLNCAADNLCRGDCAPPRGLMSWHKAAVYTNWLHCPEALKTMYYRKNGEGGQNLDFIETNRIANERFGPGLLPTEQIRVPQKDNLITYL